MLQATLEKKRQDMLGYARKPNAIVPYERRTIPGGRNSPPITVLLINSRATALRPVILHTHGGGFVMGSAEAGLADLQDIDRDLDCVIVSVEYRLAPEVTFKGSVEDNYAALKWVHDAASSIGADSSRIALLGDSAGGGHAALLAIAARNRGEVPVAFQCLVYPMLDDRTGITRPVPDHVGKIGWSAADNRFGWESFLGVEPGRRSAPKGAVPARVDDLRGLPPAFIGVGSIDLFHDEDVDYAQRLNAAGVPTELLVVPGAFHGFDAVPLPLRISQRFKAAKLNALRQGLGIPAV